MADALGRRPERFIIDVPDEQLADLRARLRATRWPDALPGSGWDYGTDRTYLQELCASWADDFDWRRAEARLNCRALLQPYTSAALVGRASRRDDNPV